MSAVVCLQLLCVGVSVLVALRGWHRHGGSTTVSAVDVLANGSLSGTGSRLAPNASNVAAIST